MSGPQHLSEFYSLVNKEASTSAANSSISIPTSLSNARYPRPTVGTLHDRNSSVSTSALSPVEGDQFHIQSPPSAASRYGMFRKASVASLGTVTSTIASTSYAAGVATNHPDLPALITSREVNETLNSYTGVLSAAQKYREALLTVSSAAADFGAALEDCARCKGAGSSAESLLAAGGLHYLVSNHQQILAKSIHRTFEVPVRRQVELFKSTMVTNDGIFKKEMRAKARQLKKNELENMRLSRMRVRNLAAYRSSLLELTSQIDDIDRLKYDHFCLAYDVAQATSTNILMYAASVVRAEVEIYEGIARKGWSGGGLDDLISACPDPFASNEEEEEEYTNFPTVSKSTGNKFMETIHGLLNPSSASATTAASSATIKSLKPTTSFASASTALAAGSTPKKNSKQSTTKSLFSILPSKSILPSFDSKFAANDTVSYDSDSEEDDDDDDSQVLDNSNILGSSSSPQTTTAVADSRSGGEIKDANITSGTNILADSFFTTQISTTPKNSGSFPSSLSSGFINQVSASTPIKNQSPLSPNMSPKKTSKKRAETSNNISPHHIVPVHVSAASRPALGTSADTQSTGSIPKRSSHLHGGSETDSDDMLGYSGWGNIRSPVP